MPYSLEFSRVHDYASRGTGIIVPIALSLRSRRAAVLASLDTGASHCLFARVYAEALGLSVQSGQPMMFATANSRFEAFGHELGISVLGFEMEMMAYFFADPNISKNVLGRSGWLDRFRLGLVDYDRKLYPSIYEDGY